MEENKREYHRRYYEKNKEKLRQQSKEYRKENKEKIRQYREDNKEKRIQYSKDYREKYLERVLFQNAKKRANKKGIAFEITEQDIVIPEYCPYLRCKIEKVKGDRTLSPSLDRIVPSLGYVKGNIQVISDKANRMKNDATQDELVTFAESVLKLHTGRKAAEAALVEVFLEEL